MRRCLLAALVSMLLAALMAGCAGAQLEEDSFGFTASDFKERFNKLADDDIGDWEGQESYYDETERIYYWDFGNGVQMLVSTHKDTDAVISVFTHCKVDTMTKFMNYFPSAVAVCDEPAITGKGEYVIDDVVEELGLFDEESYNHTNETIDKGKISYRFMANESEFSINIFITGTQEE